MLFDCDLWVFWIWLVCFGVVLDAVGWFCFAGCLVGFGGFVDLCLDFVGFGSSCL